MEALSYLNRFSDALNAAKQGSQYDKEMFKDSISPLENKVKIQVYNTHVISSPQEQYANKINLTDLSITYIDSAKGKGIKSLKSFERGQTIFEESPLYQIQKTVNKVKSRNFKNLISVPNAFL
jgi:hypothetical protein